MSSMKKIWTLFVHDVRSISHNVIALVVCVGLVVLPSLYAWLNIEGSWDPYGHTSELKIAVANDDEGYKSSLIPVNVNIGERAASKLRESTSINYIYTTHDDAMEGVRSGRYYAALIIPKDFSKNLLSGLGSDGKSDPDKAAAITYVSNEKIGAIAPLVTDKAAESARTQIESGFTDALTEVGAGVLGELSTSLDDPHLMNAAATLDASLERSISTLHTISEHIKLYGDLISSSQSIVSSTSDLMGSTNTAAQNASNALSSASDGTDALKAGALSAGNAVDSALASTTESFEALDGAIDSALDTTSTTATHTSSNLRALADKVGSVAQRYQSLLADIKNIQAALPSHLQSILDAPIARIQGTIDTQQSLQERLSSTADAIDKGVSVSESDRAEIRSLVAQAKKDVASTQSELKNTLNDQLDSLSSALDGATSDTSAISASINETISQLKDVSSSTNKSLDSIKEDLATAQKRIDSLADSLGTIHTSLSQALAGGDLSAVRRILSANSTDLASFISSPTQLERTAVYPVANNGSAMAGFYTTLSLWVGAIVLVAMLLTGTDQSFSESIGAKPRHSYVSRLLVFSIFGFLQATLVGLGDLYYLGIQCIDPVRFMLTLWIASFVYVNIMYALTYAFGDVGKAIAVFLLVIQVAGSGGTFPIQMLPQSFQNVNALLPFVHTINAMHETIAGYYGNVWISEVAIQGTYLAGALLLGLVLRKPLVRANKWIAQKLESTKIM